MSDKITVKLLKSCIFKNALSYLQFRNADDSTFFKMYSQIINFLQFDLKLHFLFAKLQ